MSCTLFLALLALTMAPMMSDAFCFTTNSSGIPLPPHYNERGEIDCLDGFVCPYLDPLNVSTYPVYCPPTDDCVEKRAIGEICDSQGLYEPQIVPKGHYSRDRRNVVECPAGYYCPIGSKEPIECPALTLCPKGAAKKYHYGLLIFYAVSLIVLTAIVQVYRRVFAFSTLMHEVENGEGFVESGGSTPKGFSTGTSSNSSDDGSPKNRSRKVQLLCDGFRRRRGATKPLKFEFHNLRVTVPLEGGTAKNLLNNVSGHFSPGKVTAIMGPSGAGKTTLMNALLGKLPPNFERSGVLLVNGEAQLAKYRPSIGFVPQDDVLHTELSVFKNLYYSSEIRLPKEWSSVERNLFRSAVVDILGLAESRDVQIGDGIERGVSGGQRKRASIGLELVAAPLAILLDEPTSGLDAFAAMELCLLLREIALQTHLCVAMVIHQPRAEIWHALDELLILAPGGTTVYQGPQSEARAYFEACGVAFPADANPADVVMDAVADRPAELIQLWAERTGEDLASPDKATRHLVAADDAEAASVPWPGASPLRQVLLSHNRAVEKELSRMQSFMVEILVATLCGLVLGNSMMDYEHLSLYRDPYKAISLQPFDALLPQLNLYSIMSISLAGATAGVRLLGDPMKQYYRETASGHSRIAYFLGGIWAATYRMVLCTYCFCAFYFFIPGLNIPFGDFYVIFLSCYWCMYALASPIAVLSSAANAPLISSLGGIVAGIFSGFVDYPVALKYLSFGFYTAQTLHRLYDETVATAMDSSHEAWDYDLMSTGAAVAINFSWGIIVFAIAFVLLINVNKERQR